MSWFEAIWYVVNQKQAVSALGLQRVLGLGSYQTAWAWLHIARGSEVRTDAWTGDDEIGRYRFDHVVTNMSSSGDPAHVALPHVHLVASLLKRWILGTHQGAISHAQLDYYLDEFTFRFHRRRARVRGLLFHRLLEGALAAVPHRYKELVTQSRKQPAYG